MNAPGRRFSSYRAACRFAGARKLAGPCSMLFRDSSDGTLARSASVPTVGVPTPTPEAPSSYVR
jgi:hypothetical protein